MALPWSRRGRQAGHERTSSTTMGDSEMSQRAASGAAARQVETIGLAATHLHGDAYEIQIRGHRLTVDQPVEAGGANLGPTPTELFAASLAACVGFYAGRFLRRHGLAAEGLRVHCEATMSGGRPARVEAISLRLDGLPMLADRQRVALLAVVEHCTVHNSIRQAPEVKVELASGQPAAIGPAAVPAPGLRLSITRPVPMPNSERSIRNTYGSLSSSGCSGNPR